MNKVCILSDFDGTITDKDGLYAFISTYAQGDWQKIEQDWVEGKISSKECLIEEFNLVPNLSEELIDNFINTLTIDKTFINFYSEIVRNNINFYIVSDGIDYFIDKIFSRYGISGIKIISNHGEFVNGKFVITFPNDNPKCINNAGTCKCSVLSGLKNKYEKIIYIGDGVSDFCVAGKADILYAKSRLKDFCKGKNIKCIPFDKFADIKIFG